MKKMAMRTFALLLAALMVLSLIPVMPHVHAEGEGITYGAKWEYMVTKVDETTGETIEDYSWVQGVFKTADEDFIYGTSYDWSVTMSPTKAAASVTVEAIILQEDPAVEGGIEVARVTKDVDVSKAPSTTTLLSYADVAEQMAGKTGNFLLTLTTYWDNPVTGNADAIAQLKTVFAYTGNASDDEAVEDGGDQSAVELGATWEFAASYGSWLKGAFETAETDFVYEKGKEYDWSITLQQYRTTVNLTVDTVVKDAEGKTLASLLNQTVTCYKGSTGSPMVSASDLPDLDGDLLGIFAVECTIKYSGNPVAKATVRYSRTGAVSGFDNDPDEAISVQYKTGHEWIGAAFQYGEEDLIYEEDRPYDWALTISPANAVASDLTVVASIVDANGKTVSTLEKMVAAADITRAPSITTLVDFREFAELTRDLAGTFTLKCDIKIGETVYVRASAKFARTPMVLSDGWEPAANYGWVDVTAHSADADWVFENTQAYDFKVGIKQQRVDGAIMNLHAMVKDAQGSLVTELTKEVELVSSAVDYQVILEASELTALTTGIVGEFALVCEFTYGDKPVGRYTKTFSRTCNHAGTVDIPGYPATCTDYGQTTGKKCANCGVVTLAQDVIAPLNHDIVVLSERVEPTCKTEGRSAHHKCQREGCTYESGNNVLPKLTEHVPGAAATCLAPQTCIHCPEVIIVPIKTHLYSVVDGKCINGCGKTKCENEGHDLVVTKPAVFAGCTTPGKSPVRTCTRGCGYAEGGEVTEPALGHWFEDGICLDCGAVEPDATMTVTVSDEELCGGNITVTVSSSAIENCVSGGFLFAFDTNVFEYVSGTALVTGFYSAGISTVNDRIAGYCIGNDGVAVSGDLFQIVLKIKEGAAVGSYIISGTPSLTVKNGEESITLACATNYAMVTITDNHNWDKGEDTKLASCTIAGEMTYTCIICGETYVEPTLALGHKMQESAAEKIATCTIVGKTAVLTCARGCGYTTGGEAIPALGHNYVNGTCTRCRVLEEGVEADVDVSVVASQDVIYRGDTVTFTVVASLVEHCYTGAFLLDYDTEIFEFVSGQALVSGYMVAGVSDANNQIAGYFMNGDETVEGAIFEITMRVKEDAVFGDTAISGIPSFTTKVDGVMEDQLCGVLGKTVNIACRHEYGEWVEIDEVWHKHTCTICFYEETVKVEYIVTFQYADGTVIAAVPYHYGDTVLVPDAPPAQQINHAFIGWDREIEICTGEAVYTALFEEYVPGDMDGNKELSSKDAIYLLLHVIFGEEYYPLSLAPADVDRNEIVDQEDAVYLLLHTLFGEERYPLNPAASVSKED